MYTLINIFNNRINFSLLLVALVGIVAMAMNSIIPGIVCTIMVFLGASVALSIADIRLHHANYLAKSSKFYSYLSLGPKYTTIACWVAVGVVLVGAFLGPIGAAVGSIFSLVIASLLLIYLVVVASCSKLC